VVVDVGGRWAISLLSGHEGGANDLALSVSNILAAEPVITTTTEAVKTIIVGVGCRRGTPAEPIIEAIRQALATANASIEQVRLLASADIKRDEAGLLEASRQLGIPLRLVSSEEIRQSPRGFERSDFVQEKVNLPAVAEPAALLAGRRTRLLLPKQIFPSVTVALAREDTLKQELERGTPADGGKLYVVGIGPGGPLDRTRRAEAAIAESQVVVGYHRYLRLIADLTPGKELISSGMKEEVVRCRAAIERARAGQTVSLVSSGDAGIYGMAGLAIELAHAEGAKLDGPPAGLKPAGGHPPAPPAGFNPAGGYSIEIIPGVTAANAAAARLGAPLMLDFAVISLSDLLIPWDVILGRLKALAAADLVVALYNPKSSQRVRQFQEAIAIFRQHRPAETPVGLAAAVGTEEERLTLSTLQKVLDEEVDMRTVVIIGNSMSKVVDGWFVTSRGYAL
jgi:precorrin-3B methylase